METTRIRHIYRNAQILALVLSTFLASEVQAQSGIIDRENQQWLQYANRIQFKSKWVLSSNASLRWIENFSLLSQYQINTGVGYQLTENFRFSSGVAYFRPINHSSNTHHEFRPFQELLFSQDVGKARMVNRLRMEERVLTFVEGEQLETTYLRFRYGLFFNIPVLASSKDGKRSDLELALRNETLFNGPNDQDEKLFDLERISIGPSWAMDNVSLTLFWHNQFSSLPEAKSYKYTSIVAFQVLQRIKL
ncbi:MAG: DUF2490 domain-containing protein [Bacteroidota bacterium]